MKYESAALLLLVLSGALNANGRESTTRLGADQVNRLCEARSDFSTYIEAGDLSYYGAELRPGRGGASTIRFVIDYARYPGPGPVEGGVARYEFSADGGLVSRVFEK